MWRTTVFLGGAVLLLLAVSCGGSGGAAAPSSPRPEPKPTPCRIPLKLGVEAPIPQEISGDGRPAEFIFRITNTSSVPQQYTLRVSGGVQSRDEAGTIPQTVSVVRAFPVVWVGPQPPEGQVQVTFQLISHQCPAYPAAVFGFLLQGQ